MMKHGPDLVPCTGEHFSTAQLDPCCGAIEHPQGRRHVLNGCMQHLNDGEALGRKACSAPVVCEPLTTVAAGEKLTLLPACPSVRAAGPPLACPRLDWPLKMDRQMLWGARSCRDWGLD